MRMLKAGFVLGILVTLGTGCATRVPYQGPISAYYYKPAATRPATPVPAQVLVHSSAAGASQTKMDLARIFTINLKQSGKFADIVPAGAPESPVLKRLDMDVNLTMDVANSTSPFYVLSWGCIFPMFIPLNKITADGQMTVAVSDKGAVIKTYTAKTTSVLHRNSVGLAWIRTETQTLERWCRPALTALLDDMMNQIVADTETYKKYDAQRNGP